MKPFTATQESILLVLAVFGFLVPNGIFLYAAVVDPDAVRQSFSNPVAIVLWLEALLLLVLFCWLIHRNGNPKPGWIVFLILSIIGSLACSVPAFLWMWNRSTRVGSVHLK